MIIEKAYRTEADFEQAVAEVADYHLAAVGGAVLRQCGLDVAVFSASRGLKLIEAKVYSAARNGSIGFGTQSGGGPQSGILGRPAKDLKVIDGSVAWAFADLTRLVGSKRFALISSSQAAALARGSVRKGKQNNFNANALAAHFVDWGAFCAAVGAFI